MNNRRSLINDFLPPICYLLSLGLFIAAFAMLATDAPQPDMELHRARIGNDEEYTEMLEEKLEARRLKHKVMIGSLFGLAVLAAVAGYMTMRPSHGA